MDRALLDRHRWKRFIYLSFQIQYITQGQSGCQELKQLLTSHCTQEQRDGSYVLGAKLPSSTLTQPRSQSQRTVPPTFRLSLAHITKATKTVPKESPQANLMQTICPWNSPQVILDCVKMTIKLTITHISLLHQISICIAFPFTRSVGPLEFLALFTLSSNSYEWSLSSRSTTSKVPSKDNSE